MSRVAILVAVGFEEIEALTVVDLLRRSNIDADLVSITGERYVKSSHGIKIQADQLFEEVDFHKVDMIVLPGGMPGTENLEKYEPLMLQLDAFNQSGKYISAICAAPSILGHRGMLVGRNACCFPEYESHLTGANVSKNEVEISNHIITSRGMGCSIPFGLAIVKRFLGQAVSDELKKKIIYQNS